MRRISFFLAIMALSVLVIWGLFQNDSRDEANDQKEKTEKADSEPEVNSDKLQAYHLATSVVIESLQEPYTAEFPTTKEKLEHTAHLGGGKYRINSWVDSQDTYGAKARRNFRVVLKMDSSGLEIEDFRIEEYAYIPKNNP